MRGKSITIRSSRDSLDPSASLPDDEANGVSSTHCESGDADVENVPNTFGERDVPHKKRHCLGINEIDRGRSVDPLNLDACIVCEVADKRVWRCSGNDCLLSFHGECLYADLGSSSEHLSNPYCPYCWLKILALRSKSLREKTVGADKAVFKYLDKKMKGRDEDATTLSGGENGNKERSMDGTDIVSDQELQGDKYVSSSKVQVEKGFDKSRDENMPLIEETDQPDDEERVATENFQDAEDNETAKDQTNFSRGAGKKGDASPFLSMQESFSGKEHDQVQQNEKQRRSRRRRRRRLIEVHTDSEVSSKESSNERNGEDLTEQINASAHVTSPSRKMKNQQREPTATTQVVVAKPRTVRDISFFKDQKRRLLWTLEEEEMLKAGVEKFAAAANKNMPWRKILEMGEKVFHESRTPSDLKDKWRKMVGARLGPKTSQAAN